MLVTFEGIEGAGKSTLIAALAADALARGDDVLVTREPGGTPFGDAVRRLFIDPAFAIDPLAETMLVNASRAQLVVEVIAPALKAGTTVLCDRFFDATVAYQGYGRGLDVEALLEICLAATHRIAPDLTFLLDVPVAVSRARIRARASEHDRIEREDDAFHARVRDGYLALARRFPRIHVLDATASPDALHATARAELDRRRSFARP